MNTKHEAINRLHSLDYLRGLAALFILLFHYFTWSFGEFDASTFWGRIGLYGVSIFYILSGMTLYRVYASNLFEPGGLRRFYIKRVFRIYPLLILASFGAIILGARVDWYQILLNVTGLFGFVAWDQNITVGAWSIGNELVFYALFPMFMFTWLRQRYLFFMMLFALGGVYCWFAFAAIDPQQTISASWHLYVNPLNQVLLFALGFLIGSFKQRPAFWGYVLVMIGVALFIFYPISGDRVHLISGFGRLTLTFASLLICCGTYFLPPIPIPIVHRLLSQLGESSYSVYLLHPLVYSTLIAVGIGNGPILTKITVASVLTISFAWLVYQRFEKPLMRLGQRY